MIFATENATVLAPEGAFNGYALVESIASSIYCIKFGAGEGIRTLDPDLGKVVLYH